MDSHKRKTENIGKQRKKERKKERKILACANQKRERITTYKSNLR